MRLHQREPYLDVVKETILSEGGSASRVLVAKCEDLSLIPRPMVDGREPIPKLFSALCVNGVALTPFPQPRAHPPLTPQTQNE